MEIRLLVALGILAVFTVATRPWKLPRMTRTADPAWPLLRNIAWLSRIGPWVVAVGALTAAVFSTPIAVILVIICGTALWGSLVVGLVLAARKRSRTWSGEDQRFATHHRPDAEVGVSMAKPVVLAWIVVTVSAVGAVVAAIVQPIHWQLTVITGVVSVLIAAAYAVVWPRRTSGR